jgi:L-alanine-DL-glutamate epimerase-like enolase superfamily enzyme
MIGAPRRAPRRDRAEPTAEPLDHGHAHRVARAARAAHVERFERARSRERERPSRREHERGRVGRHRARAHAAIERIESEVFVVPTDRPESDGTFAWNETTLVLVRVHGGGAHGMGWTYASGAAAELAEGPLARAVEGLDATATSAAWSAMNRALRNIGRPGLGWEALSAVDVALWDLAGKLLDAPLARLLGAGRRAVRAYGSGGFTSYDDAMLEEQLGGWADAGFTAVKMKVGRDPRRDPHRVAIARDAIGPRVELFVDANGAWSRKQALSQSELFARWGVSWLEEPVSSEDLEGLRLVRDRAPAGMDVAAGEYGYVLDDFRRTLLADCLDVVQADATRCGGVTGLLAVSALCEAFGVPLSTHCAPHLHATVGCALRPLRHVEYFHDHARIERSLFEGAIVPDRGELAPDPDRPGLGVELSRRAERFRVR